MWTGWSSHNKAEKSQPSCTRCTQLRGRRKTGLSYCRLSQAVGCAHARGTRYVARLAGRAVCQTRAAAVHKLARAEGTRSTAHSRLGRFGRGSLRSWSSLTPRASVAGAEGFDGQLTCQLGKKSLSESWSGISSLGSQRMLGRESDGQCDRWACTRRIGRARRGPSSTHIVRQLPSSNSVIR